MKEEVRKILEMIEKGQVTSAQAAELLDAMESFGQQQEAPRPVAPGKRQMRIKISSASGKEVDFKVPATMINSGIHMNHLFSGRSGRGHDSVRDVDWDQLSGTVKQMLENGTTGQIIHIENPDGGEVDISLE
jgi:hypothetical protein